MREGSKAMGESWTVSYESEERRGERGHLSREKGGKHAGINASSDTFAFPRAQYVCPHCLRFFLS